MSSNSQERINTSDMEVDELNKEYDTDEEGGMKIDDDIYIPPPLKTFCEVDTTGPRLMITKIVNVNFKSYAGTTIIGPFHKVNFNMTRMTICLLNVVFNLIFFYRASRQ